MSMAPATATAPALAIGREQQQQPTISTSATDSTIDAYASRILKQKSPPEACVDDSLGPYVTSVLRSCCSSSSSNLKDTPEFEALLELLQEHCSLSVKEANDILQTIATSVQTGFVVPEEQTWNGPFLTAAAVESRYSNDDDEQFPPLLSSNVSTPIKADGLIPFDLLGALDDPATPTNCNSLQQQRQQSDAALNQKAFPPLGDDTEDSKSIPQSAASQQEEFPPLGAESADHVQATTTNGTSKKGNKGKKTKSKKLAADDLAAVFFRSSRVRQSSIDSLSPKLKPLSSSAVAEPSLTRETTLVQQQESISPEYLDAAVDMLWSMNPTLSQEAVTDALLMVNGDMNMAQYVIGAALAAPPVCRHMLNEGCYRSDCHFNHNLDGKTCLFWMRGRCANGDTCRFLHGYAESLLEMDGQQQQHTEEYFASPTQMSAPLSIGSGQRMMSPQAPFAPRLDTNSLSAPFLSSSHTSYSSGAPFTAYSSRDGSGSQASSWGATSSLESLVQNVRLEEPIDAAPTTSTGYSFANVATDGYNETSFQDTSSGAGNFVSLDRRTVRIPQDLWHDHINRDSSVFYLADPMERYREVSSSVSRDDIIDLHYQSTKTFPVVLSEVLPSQLRKHHQVWIVTGSGHHVSRNTHQKGGGALESAVAGWLVSEGYNFQHGRDRNGHGGALLVTRQ
jgi:hypothetical protein